MTRWKLERIGQAETYEFPINPNEHADFIPDREIRWTHTRQGFTGIRAGRTPHPSSFSGVLRSQAQLDALLLWTGRREKIHLTTDLGQKFVVRLMAFKPQQQGAGRNRHAPFRMTYTMDILIFDTLVTGVDTLPPPPSPPSPPPTPPTPAGFFDSFDRANNLLTLGPEYSIVTFPGYAAAKWGIESNQASVQSGDVGVNTAALRDAGSARMYVEATVDHFQTGEGVVAGASLAGWSAPLVWLSLRNVDFDETGTGKSELSARIHYWSGSATSVSPWYFGVTFPALMRLEIDGGVARAYVNGALRITYNLPAALPAGHTYAGLHSLQYTPNVRRFNDLAGGPLT